MNEKTKVVSVKQLLVCPNCHYKGEKRILGEIDNEGNLVVQVSKYQNGCVKTKVVSSEMEILCGVCNEVVFYRKKK